MLDLSTRHYKWRTFKLQYASGFTKYTLKYTVIQKDGLNYVVGRSFCLYTDSLFAQIGDSNDEWSSSLEVECWNEDETHAAQQSPTQF